VYVEAGFPYTDAGFTVSDDLDGDGATWKYEHWAQDKAGCMVDGNTVTDSCRHAQHRSCGQIKQACPSCTSGNYCIRGQSEELEVWCDMTKNAVKTILSTPKCESGCATVQPSVQSYLQPPAAKFDNNWCNTQAGFEMATLTNTVNYENAQIRFGKAVFFEKYGCAESAPVAEQEAECLTKNYLCTLKSETDASDAAVTETVLTHKGAEVGSFAIKYYCKDAAGNEDEDWANGTPVGRTVEVQDTLAPVITLHMQDQLIASSIPKAGEVRAKGLNGVDNPAELSHTEMASKAAPYSTIGAGNPNLSLMAESTTSVNGWIIGALASAVSGLALLGYSLRKTNSVVTSVPV